MRKILVSMDEGMIKALTVEGARQGRSRSNMIRVACATYLTGAAPITPDAAPPIAVKRSERIHRGAETLRAGHDHKASTITAAGPKCVCGALKGVDGKWRTNSASD